MTQDDFRRLALQMPGATEGAHMGHADFRAGNRIFATLGSPGPAFGMVKLTPAQQEILVAAEPAIFSPAKGGWGRDGSTLVVLDRASEETLLSALTMARGSVRP